MWHHLFETSLGWVGLCGVDRRVSRVFFGDVSAERTLERLRDVSELGAEGFAGDGLAGDATCQDRFIREVEQRIRSHALTGRERLDRIPIMLGEATEFQSRVLGACREIPIGETRSYQELAQAAGSPNAYRAVGNIMARNRLPLLIPCHRVLGSGGRVGGFSAPQGVEMKLRLLELEGVEVGELTGSSR